MTSRRSAASLFGSTPARSQLMSSLQWRRKVGRTWASIMKSYHDVIRGRIQTTWSKFEPFSTLPPPPVCGRSNLTMRFRSLAARSLVNSLRTVRHVSLLPARRGAAGRCVVVCAVCSVCSLAAWQVGRRLSQRSAARPGGLPWPRQALSGGHKQPCGPRGRGQ